MRTVWSGLDGGAMQLKLHVSHTQPCLQWYFAKSSCFCQYRSKMYWKQISKCIHVSYIENDSKETIFFPLTVLSSAKDVVTMQYNKLTLLPLCQHCFEQYSGRNSFCWWWWQLSLHDFRTIIGRQGNVSFKGNLPLDTDSKLSLSQSVLSFLTIFFKEQLYRFP